MKEVQLIVGRMASLGPFLARAGEIGLRFYQTLRRRTKSTWTADVSKTVQKLKAYPFSPPLLVTPIHNKVLNVYLSITANVISSVLWSKRDNNMKPLYYVSHVLNGPEGKIHFVFGCHYSKIKTVFPSTRN